MNELITQKSPKHTLKQLKQKRIKQETQILINQKMENRGMAGSKSRIVENHKNNTKKRITNKS